MIQFPCADCRQVILVSDDDAGRRMQCPACGRLNDVPAHSDLAGDVAFKLSQPSRSARRPTERLVEASSTGSVNSPQAGSLQPPSGSATEQASPTGGVNDQGQKTTLRNAPEELTLKPGEPQSDAETGEPVRSLDVVPAADIPMAVVAPARAVTLSYSTLRDPELKRRSRPRMLLEPANVAVMAFVLLGLVFGYIVQQLVTSLVFAISEQTFDLPVWPLNMMFWLAAAHFGNTIVMIGPEDHDELPRPLLSLDFWDDVAAPTLKVLGAVLLCYAPMFAVLAIAGGRARAVALPLMLVGGYYFPAVLMTVMTSGSIANLHPQRLRAIIRFGGKHYLFLAAGWMIAFPAYVWATLRVNLIFSSLGIEAAEYRVWEILLAGPLAAITVVYLHYFCWQLGLMFRAGHDRFGWVWEELARQQEEDRRSRSSLSIDDRATMRSARQERAAAAERAQHRDPRSRMGPR